MRFPGKKSCSSSYRDRPLTCKLNRSDTKTGEKEEWCSLKGTAGLVLSKTVSVGPCNSLMAGRGGKFWQGLKVKIFYTKSLGENRDASHSNMQNSKASKYRRRQSSVFSKTSPPRAVTKGSRRRSGPCLHSPSPRQSTPLRQEHCGADSTLHGTVPVTPPRSPPHGL